ncbi:MAG: dihydrofolate reductase [Bacteroidia bacterium]|nr:dihydrofolate reductase [Bacteroidia bacterium]
MRKLIAAINMTLDGFSDHKAIIPDDELHEHYANLLRDSGVILYGRITYQLMEYWRPLVKNPTGNKATDEFAVIMNNTPKIVFTHTLRHIDWESARLANRNIEEEVLALQQQPGKDILVGSPSLIAALTQLGLIDEYQLCIHPVILGKGLTLFKNIHDKINLKLINTKRFNSGAMLLYYEAGKQ